MKTVHDLDKISHSVFQDKTVNYLFELWGDLSDYITNEHDSLIRLLLMFSLTFSLCLQLN